MRETVERPDALIDVTALSAGIDSGQDGGLLIGAAATNTALAGNRHVREHYPMLARAILAGASAQIRNMATVGGNILQRTRCTYFYDDAARCNKRTPGSGCDAIDGFNRIHAILGASSACVATHPSDMCVALAALDAVVHLHGPQGERTMRFTDLHRLPGDTPDIETELRPHELITAVALPALPAGMRQTLSQDTRPRELRLRARFGRRGTRPRAGRLDPRRAACVGRRCAQAMAGLDGGGSLAGPQGRRGHLPRRRGSGTGRCEAGLRRQRLQDRTGQADDRRGAGRTDGHRRAGRTDAERAA